ncbi:PP2C family protein-serine/threonine phosphatase [Sulfurivermis fontis]|uniref:PP2C family protein-serine/threonine phosphatase n=1 Tax=Sulfurivermis fontis TaxID=1972068 RepID=UPI000FD751E7|nr:protein phosphatase 2C domain-containing protein [Sulfurivermis fontis]
MHYETGVANHLGNRNSNQDRFDIVETDEGVLLVLADGMGGHIGGEIAAQALVDIARDRYLNSTRPVAQPGRFLTAIIQATHDALVSYAAEQGSDNIPGTTAVLCLVQNGQIDWAHVGDSRLYLFRDGLPVFRTTDHSYVEQLYQQGIIRRSEQDTHPRRNHITQCIGALPQAPEVEVGKGKKLRVGDIVLLCSDGLWGALDDAQLGLMLRQEGSLDEVLEHMAMRAEQISYPHSDNISVIALRLTSLAAAEPRPRPPEPPKPVPESKPATPHVDDAKLQSAIAQIEEVLRTYQDELKR